MNENEHTETKTKPRGSGSPWMRLVMRIRDGQVVWLFAVLAIFFVPPIIVCASMAALTVWTEYPYICLFSLAFVLWGIAEYDISASQKRNVANLNDALNYIFNVAEHIDEANCGNGFISSNEKFKMRISKKNDNA